MAASFPKTTLQQALDVPNALMRNGGNPLTAIDLATAIGKSPGSSTIRTLSAASSAYGLTGGGLKSTTAMEKLGKAITSPTPPEEKARSLVAAALRPAVFKSVYDYYKGKKLPEKEFLVNTIVREFGVAGGSTAETFADIFLANMEFVGLTRKTPSGAWLTNDPEAARVEPAAVPGTDDGEITVDGTREDLDQAPTPRDEPPTSPPARDAPKNAIFVGHGGNKKPMEQLVKILNEYGIPHKEAVEEANRARPIPQKVAETMRECGAAILVFTADKEYFDKEGNSVWRPSENVSHELGAASVLYGERIVVFKEKGIELPSNFSSVGYIEFEKDKLSDKGIELFRELVSMKILSISVG